MTARGRPAAERNDKLRKVLDARAQVRSGAITADQAIDMLVFSMLEPFERRLVQYVIEHPKTSSTDIVLAHYDHENECHTLDVVHVSTALKGLYDNGILDRKERRDPGGRYFVYWLKGNSK